MAENNGNRDQYEQQYFSRVRFNEDGGKLSMSFKYWKGMFCILLDEWNNESQEYKNLQYAFFSPMKARVMALALDKFIEDAKHDPVGVDLGMGETKTCVTIAHSKDGDILYMCDVNPDGTREKEMEFHFAPHFNYSIEYSNYKDMKWNKISYDNLEVKIIRDMLYQFAEAMLGGTAYSVMDYQRFHNARVDKNMNSIMEKLGIQTYNSNGQSRQYNRNSNNVFSGSGSSDSSIRNTGSTHRDVDELDDLLGD